VQYSTTGDILDNIFSMKLCNCSNRTAYAIKKNALTNIFLNLVQLRITRGFLTNLCDITIAFLTCSVFLISQPVLHQVYEIPGYFYHPLGGGDRK
jgi:hypothetical protein